MKERIKGVFTKKKIFHFLKMALFVVALSLILLSLLGTVAHATGLVDDTINAENLYSKYPLSNYQLFSYLKSDWSDEMSDIFKDMQANVGCDYISNLPSYKRKVWHEMKRLPLTNYDIKQLEDFSKYVFGMSYQSLKDVMKQQKGREEEHHTQTVHDLRYCQIVIVVVLDFCFHDFLSGFPVLVLWTCRYESFYTVCPDFFCVAVPELKQEPRLFHLNRK
jgi:hypothetical protein